MFTACLTVAQRETFNELANRDNYLDQIRNDMNQEKWLSDETEIFWITTEQKNALLSVWNIITPK